CAPNPLNGLHESLQYKINGIVSKLFGISVCPSRSLIDLSQLVWHPISVISFCARAMSFKMPQTQLSSRYSLPHVPQLIIKYSFLFINSDYRVVDNRLCHETTDCVGIYNGSNIRK